MEVKDLFGSPHKLDWGGYAACRDEAAHAGGAPAAQWLAGQTGAGPGADMTALSGGQGVGGGYAPRRAVTPFRAVQDSGERRSS